MQRFINPYNFIGLSDAPKREKEKEGKKLTGCIEYKIKTKSCLFIPNTSSEKAFKYNPDPEEDPQNEHKLYDFFSYNTLEKEKTYDAIAFEPIIPGSEMRGMVRSIYETLTNSCLTVLDGERRIGKRTVEHFKPAILRREKNGKIYLIPANNCDAIFRNKKDFSVKAYETCKFRDGSKVYFKKSETGKPYIKPDVLQFMDHGGKDIQVGYLLKGNKGPEILANKFSKCMDRGKKCIMLSNGKCRGYREGRAEQPRCLKAEKHCAHIFYFTPQSKKILLDQKSMESLQIILEQYLKQDESSYKEYYEAHQEFLAGNTDGLPAYYSTLDDSDYIMLSPACITREIYRNTISKIVGLHGKCNSSERSLCPGCKLFGIVNSKIAQGSKIRFTDLHPAERKKDNKEYYYDQLITLAPLSVPHPQNTEFYLQKPSDPDGEVWFWTYDYYTVRKSNGQVVVKSYTPEISGRKYYWNNLLPINNYPQKTGLNKTVRAVRPGIEFCGKVYFDEISEEQLKQLIYILTYTSDGKHGYKLGAGKPLGLGSIEMSIESAKKIVVRVFDKNGYKSETKTDEELKKIQTETFEKMGFDINAEKSFELMTRYLDDASMRCVQYPNSSNEKNEEGFQWFVKNKRNHRYNSREKKVEHSIGNSPRLRIQTEIRNNLPQIDKGEIPWLPKQ